MRIGLVVHSGKSEAVRAAEQVRHWPRITTYLVATSTCGTHPTEVPDTTHVTRPNRPACQT